MNEPSTDPYEAFTHNSDLTILASIELNGAPVDPRTKTLLSKKLAPTN